MHFVVLCSKVGDNSFLPPPFLTSCGTPPQARYCRSSRVICMGSGAVPSAGQAHSLYQALLTAL